MFLSLPCITIIQDIAVGREQLRLALILKLPAKAAAFKEMVACGKTGQNFSKS